MKECDDGNTEREGCDEYGMVCRVCDEACTLVDVRLTRFVAMGYIRQPKNVILQPIIYTPRSVAWIVNLIVVVVVGGGYKWLSVNPRRR